MPRLRQPGSSVTRATQDYNRYANLIQDHSITQQQYEQAQAAKGNRRKTIRRFYNRRKSRHLHKQVLFPTQSNATAEQIGVSGMQW